MNTQNFLAHLRELNIKLWIEGDRLRVDAPKGALTPELRAELAQRKEDILSFLQPANTRAEQKSIPPLQPVQRDQPLPLSFAQQRLWFFDQLVPGNPVYNIYTALPFQGQLNLRALEQSLNELIRRHESLRTIFPIVNGQPVQRILPFQPQPLQTIDLRHVADEKRAGEFQQVAREESKRSFDLTKGPLFRVMLVQLDEEAYELLFNIHHIIADGWSIGLIFRELGALYQAFSASQPVSLPELPIQYADFAVWQRQWLTDSLQPQLEYWKKQLVGPFPVLELPSDHPRPKIQSFNGSSHTFTVPLDMVNDLKTLGQRAEATLFMTLLAAFKVLLFRYTGQEDMLVGTPVAGRTRIEIEKLIGLFVNTLVLRTRLADNPSFLELLSKVRDVSLDAFARQDVPFEHLVEALQPERDATHSPLFQVMFVYEKSLTTPLEIDNSTAKFDLTLFVWEETDRLTVRMEYSTDLFEADTIQRMAGHLLTLLEAIVANPDQRIAELSLLAPAEKQLLDEWNRTELDYPRDTCLHQLFERQAEQTPDKVAVVFENEQLTYRQLNQRANQLAHHLQTLGVGAETPVGLSMARSTDMVVALLGILKAGGTYIPMDPLFPQHRLEYMLETSRTRIVLTRGQTSSEGKDLLVVDLDRDWNPISQYPLENLASTTDPENLAYIIFTSGSTGHPKGVQIPHRAVVNFLTSMRQKPGITANDKLLSVTTLSFDISVLEIFLPLTTGACVVLVPGESVYDGAALIQQLQTGDITVMQATPATWQMLISAGWQGDQNLKILCGGEAMSPELAGWLTQHTGSVWNMYGPTETTVWSTICEITRDTEIVTIGRPIANTQTYILDQSLASVPVGVAGELFIGGDGVARGYLNQPDLTAERFLSDPFRKAGSRMYRTGDQARFLADGQIDFVGRTDFQVKVRGFRIELGEIETTLNSHPEISQAVVIAREDTPGDKRLVAYLISETGAQPEAGELRQFIRAKLPEYMVPSFFVFLDEFPMTPNRKVNRKALPAPEQSILESEKEFIGSRTETEERVTKIWANILGVHPIDVYANFFELGGHSLLATRVMSHIREEFQIGLPLQSLFMNPTIAGLSESIDTMLWATRGQLTASNMITGNKDALEI